MALTKSKKKRAGDFDKRVDFENWVESGGDGMGGSEGSWSKEATLYASINPVSGRERIHNEAIQSDITHVIQTRKTDFDISGESRVVWGSRSFNLKYVLNQREDGAFVEIAATEKQ